MPHHHSNKGLISTYNATQEETCQLRPDSDSQRSYQDLQGKGWVPLRIPVNIRVQDMTITGVTQDISPDGLQFVSQASLSQGVPLELTCSFGELCYLNLAGHVAYCHPHHTAGNLIGVKLVAVRPWEHTILRSAIEELGQNPAIHPQSFLSISMVEDALALEASHVSPTQDFRPRRVSTPGHRSCVHASKIVGWGAYLPDRVVPSPEINDLVTTTAHKNVGDVVEALTGIKTRRYAGMHQCPSDLAVSAARQALNDAGMDPKDLDAIIFFGISRDFHEPATANVVQDKLGATNAYVYDLANACNGFITAVDTLDAMITAGRCENGLVVTGELISPYIDWAPRTKQDFKLSIFGYTISDSGGAAVLTRTAPGESRGIKARWFASAGSHWDLAIAGELEGANPHNKYFRSRGLDLEATSIQIMPHGYQEIMHQLDWTESDLALVIPHQIPISILKNMYHKAVGIPLDKLHWIFPDHGNLATASMPVAMCNALETGKVKPGDKLLLAGAAAGFSAGYIGLVV